MKRPRAYSPVTLGAARLLGAQIALGRKSRAWTIQGLADRIGVTAKTMSKIERGDPTVALGVAFEAATVAGVALFTEDQPRLASELARAQERLALLPSRVRARSSELDDAF